MNPKELIKADSETFWQYMAKTRPDKSKQVNVTPDKAKKSLFAKGKNKGPS